MIKKLILLLITVFICGCSGTNNASEISNDNFYHIDKLCINNIIYLVAASSRWNSQSVDVSMIMARDINDKPIPCGNNYKGYHNEAI